jgi:hypothetical protein
MSGDTTPLPLTALRHETVELSYTLLIISSLPPRYYQVNQTKEEHLQPMIQIKNYKFDIRAIFLQ